MTPEMEKLPQLLVSLAATDKDHWNLINDPAFPSCLEQFKARHKAKQASGTPSTANGASQS